MSEIRFKFGDYVIPKIYEHSNIHRKAERALFVYKDGDILEENDDIPAKVFAQGDPEIKKIFDDTNTTDDQANKKARKYVNEHYFLGIDVGTKGSRILLNKKNYIKVTGVEAEEIGKKFTKKQGGSRQRTRKNKRNHRKISRKHRS